MEMRQHLCILTSVGDASALLELSWYGSSSRDGDEGGDECDELHIVGRRSVEVGV